MQFWYESGPKLREWWRPGYSVTFQGARESRSVRVQVEGSASFECPKSRILRHPETADLVNIAAQAEGARGALGPVVRWPANFYDAFTVIGRAKSEDESARRAAIAKG